MMKKMIVLLLLAFFLLSLATSCGKNETSDDVNQSNSPAENTVSKRPSKKPIENGGVGTAEQFEW